MAKKEETKNTAPARTLTTAVQEQAPNFMTTGSNVAGVELLGQYVKPPRFKIVQKQSSAELLEEFNVGDVIMITPEKLLVAPVILNDKGKPTNEGTPFHVVPLFFYPEWVAWNPIEMKGTLNSIRDRSCDPASQIAAYSRSPDTREAPCPEDRRYKIRYNEHLNFIFVVIDQDNPLAFQPAVMSFARASHKHGSHLAGLIKMRKTDIFGCQFVLQTHFQSNQQGEWYAPIPANPTDVSGFVQDQNLYEEYKKLHLEFKQAHAGGLLRPDLDDDVLDAGTGVPPQEKRDM